jgi:hypothetical protein
LVDKLAALGNSDNKGETMTKRIQKLSVAFAALAALALGGSAIAVAQQPANASAPVHQSASASERVAGADGDTVQSGDQSTPDAAGGLEMPRSEQPGAAEQPGVESAPSKDGPGGHADEPGNASADYQFQGQQ